MKIVFTAIIDDVERAKKKVFNFLFPSRGVKKGAVPRYLKFVGILLAPFLLILIFPTVASADFYFNPHFIISDEEMQDFNSMSLVGIERFLEAKGSYLAGSSFSDWEDNIKPASEIIWQAALESKISPKVLLATLQKEQSLIQDPTPSLNQLNKAMGYRCPDSGSCATASLGFGKQVDGAAWQFQKYFENPQDWFYKIGFNYDIDGFPITPINQATANLYNYTPHHSGNKRFWSIWQDYFGRDYPDGSLLKAYDNPGVWFIQYGTKRLIRSWGILLSRFDPNKIITTPRSDLEKYEIGPTIQFYNYSLLGLPDGRRYLLVDDELRLIATNEAFRTIGFNPEEIEFIEEADLVGYIYGRDITVDSAYPTGALLQDNSTGGVFFVENGLKYPIYSREIMDANYSQRVLTQVSPDILDQYPKGLPVKFRDGELIKVKDDSKVYVISDGKRRWVKSEEAFANFGYKWDNIIVTSKQAVNIHFLGEDI